MTTPNRLSEPRSYLSTAVMLGVVVAPIFFVVELAFSAVWGDASVKQELPRLAFTTALFAVFWGLFMGSLLKGVTRVLPVAEWARFVADLNVATAQIGYHPSLVSDALLTFSPSWQAGLLAGRVSVQRRDGEAVIVGPSVYIGRLVIRLGVAASCASA